ncbi:MAG: M4 family peptidase, partial [Pseudomonadota bacterium]|nr:M4 family peptidase [Pseudomonadota bacterium]
MNLRKTLIAASLAALPMMLCADAVAAGPSMMASPVAAAAAEHAALISKAAAANDKRGLDQDHGYAVAAEHPGVAGTKVTRLAHTYKGVRVFQSESVMVTNDAGKLVSESVSDRRSGLGFGASSAKMGARFASFSVTPAISASAAINLVVAAVSPGAVHAAAPSAELIVFPIVASVRVAGAANKIDSELNALDLQDQVTGYEL